MEGKIPIHVAIIPDGNRRFAKKLLQKPWKGHEWGIEKIKAVVGWCKKLGIKILTFYTLSLENLSKRPKYELRYLYKLAQREIRDIFDNPEHFVHKWKVRVKCFGHLEKLPIELQKDISKLHKITSNYSDFYLNLAIAYGGRQEIVSACYKIAKHVKENILKPESISENTFRQYLQTNGNPDPDLIIRTGKEKRISNFLLFQSAYSELVFLDSYWPELTEEEFLKAVGEFTTRERRFGA